MSGAAVGRHPKVRTGWNLPRPASGHDSAAGQILGQHGAAGDRAAGAGLGDQAELAGPGHGLGAVGRAELA